MNNINLDLTKILKDVPRGTKLYSPICGECELLDIIEDTQMKPIICIDKYGVSWGFNKDGRYSFNDGECMLFPSKDNRDWSTFKVEPSVEKLAQDYLNCGDELFNGLPPKVQAIIKMLAVADHLNEGWVPDLGDASQKKYYIHYNLRQQKAGWDYGDNWGYGTCCFKDERTAEKAIEMLGEETIKTALS